MNVIEESSNLDSLIVDNNSQHETPTIIVDSQQQISSISQSINEYGQQEILFEFNVDDNKIANNVSNPSNKNCSKMDISLLPIENKIRMDKTSTKGFENNNKNVKTVRIIQRKIQNNDDDSNTSSVLEKERQQIMKDEEEDIDLQSKEMLQKTKNLSLILDLTQDDDIGLNTKVQIPSRYWCKEKVIDGLNTEHTKNYILTGDKYNFSLHEITLNSSVLENLRLFYKNTLLKIDDTSPINKLINNVIINSSLQILFTDEWLNDECINFMGYIMNIRSHVQAKYEGTRPSFFVSTYFATKLLGSDLTSFNYDQIKKWTIRSPFCNLFDEYHRIFIPININMEHWTLVVINIFEQNIQYFDSSPGGKIFDWKHHPVIRIFEF